MPYISELVQLVIGEFELVEVNDRFHPVSSESGGVWVNVKPRGRAVFLEALLPRGVLELVAIFITRRYVHEQDIALLRVKIQQLYFERWKHSPACVGKGKYVIRQQLS